ncbi:AraC family transcriptional regulator [Falsiroseomonas tokyonensis]|uniref:Helix-turn-helix domain-containing protein n=1 Tax=Falsiroseomonas tokyonensis TaxID=430521 RepID=A0ABV7C116_9PROT|nr:AraC family transcriptional regulator [Falsiroseomonas tokyonensis]MBU8540638.1 helix-turn-helix transcriptional regulator [Falsiroseomonas tokyonensis]
MFGEYVEGGSFAPFVQERRFGSSPRVGLMEIGQPPGDFSDPPTGLLIVAQARTSLQATCDIGFGRVMARAAPGNIAVQLPDAAASIVHDRPNAFRVAAIDPALPDQLSGDRRWLDVLRRPGLEQIRSREIGHVLARMWDAARQDGMASRLYVEGSTLALLGLLLREVGRGPASHGGGLAAWQVRRATAYMMENLDSEIGLAELSALVGLSPTHFCTAFRRSTGLPPHAWLTEARMERAKALLADPRLSLTEVAQTVGYGGQSAFGAAFRRATGMTPGAWRRGAAA